MTAFIFGYLLGLLTPLAALGLVLWCLAWRANSGAIAKLLHGLAMVLNYRPETPVESRNGQERKERAL